MTIATAISAAKAALDIIKLGIEARDDQKIKSAIADLQDRLFDLSTSNLQASEKLSALEATNRTLQNEIHQAETKLKERISYVLHPLKTGSFCYRYQPNPESANPEHFLCQVCYDKGIKSVLRLSERGEWNARHYICPEIGGSHDLYF